MIQVKKVFLHMFVKNILLSITLDVLSSFLKIPWPSNLVYPFHDWKDTQFEYDVIASVLCGCDRSWAGGLLYQYEMLLDYHLLNIFIAYNVEPRVHKLDANHEQTYLLYATGSGLSVDIPHCIYNAMVHMKTAPLCMSLPFWSIDF